MFNNFVAWYNPIFNNFFAFSMPFTWLNFHFYSLSNYFFSLFFSYKFRFFGIFSSYFFNLGITLLRSKDRPCVRQLSKMTSSSKTLGRLFHLSERKRASSPAENVLENELERELSDFYYIFYLNSSAIFGS